MNKQFQKIILSVLFFYGVIFCQIYRDAFAFDLKGIEITPKTSISETFDDNITFLKNDKESDFITAVKAGAKASYEGQSKSFSLEGAVTRQFFAENSNFDNTSEELSFDAVFELSKKDRVSLRNSYAHLYEPKSFLDTFGRSLGRYSYHVNKFALEYVKELSRQAAWKFFYSHELNQFARDDLGDSQSQGVGCEFDYSVSSSTVLSAFYDFSYREFHPGSQAFINSFSGGVKQYFTKQLFATLRSGIEIINAYSDKTYAKPFIRACLVDELSDKTSVKLTFNKEHTTTPYVEDMFDNWDVNLNVSSQLKKNLTGYGEVFHGKGIYAASDTKDTLHGGKCGFTFGVKKNMALDLSYSATMVNSSDEGRDYTRNLVAAGLNVEF